MRKKEVSWEILEKEMIARNASFFPSGLFQYAYTPDNTCIGGMYEDYDIDSDCVTTRYFVCID